MTDAYDAIIIGAGHNGLVCAAYLAKAGLRVLVLEARAAPGGGAVTRPFAPGFKVSACAHLLSSFQLRIARDLGVDIPFAATHLNTIALDEGGRHITLTADGATGAGLSVQNQAAYGRLSVRLRAQAAWLSGLMNMPPPRLMDGDWRDAGTLAALGWRLRFGLGRKNMRDLLRIIGSNIYDVLDDAFDDDRLKGVLAFDAVLGTALGPRSPGSVLTFLTRRAGEIHSAPGGYALARGGMGGLSDELAEIFKARGGALRTRSSVRRIVVRAGRASGVELESGEIIPGRIVISNADPKATLLCLVGAPHLDALFAHKISKIRDQGTTAKLHLALDKSPEFTGLSPAETGQRLIIAPTMARLERAFDACKYGEASEEPTLEITIPTLHDPELAPGGRHVLSAVVQYAPYNVKGGWASKKNDFTERILDRLEIYAPGLRRSILHRDLLTPDDLESGFGMSGGHWHHGELAFDQMLMMRPVPGAAGYAMPVDGLYLCGAGAHPGGGVMGAAGRNAARVILRGKDL